MTDLEIFSFPCKVCNTRIEFSCPVDIKWEYYNDTPIKSVYAKQKRFYRAKARMNHNATHKGALDLFG